MIRSVLCPAQLGSCILCLLLVLLVAPHSISASTSTAASSSTSSSSPRSADYNAYHYDRARHFTPDGRLLQVEYAMAAAEQCSPLVVCQLDRDTMGVLCCSLVSSPVHDSTTTTTTTSPKPQDRIVILEDSVVVAMSGLLADSVALLKTAFQDWQDYKQTYCGAASTEGRTMMRVLANSMGKSCHDNCFQGGIRPYGATMLLLSGAAQDSAFASNGAPCTMVQTDPPGAVTEIVTTMDETDSTVFPFVKLVHMVGGSPETRTQMEKAIGKLCDKKQRHNSSSDNKNAGNSEAKIWERLQGVSRVLVDEQLQRIEEQKKGKGMSLSERLFGRKKKTENEKNNDSIDVNDDSSGSAGGLQQPWLEAVVISRTLGIHKLTSAQIQQLLLSKAEQ